MAIIIEERENVTIRTEAYSPNIRIVGNPENALAGAVLVDLQILEYQNDILTHTSPASSVGETVGEFVERSWEINGKTITGMDLMLVVKQYVADLHAERVAAQAPATVEPTVDATPDRPLPSNVG